MKRNPKDNYYTTTNPMIIEDGDTGEQMIFLIDFQNRLVVRSLLEEDIKTFIDRYNGITSKERREKKRMLYEHISEKDSQNYFFCIERIKGIENKKIENSIYGLPREPLGICGRSDEEITLQKGKIDSEIGAFLYDYDDKIAHYVDAMLPTIAKYLEVEKTNVYFVRKPQKLAR